MSLKKYYHFIIAVMILMAILPTDSSAQDSSSVTISGRIISRDQKPVEGVLIERQGTAIKTTTDAAGRFNLVADRADIITISKAGYNTLNLAPAELNNTSLVLPAVLIDAGANDEVSIPFGTRKKRALTSAVSVLKGEELSQQPFSSLNTILTGLLPGVYVTQTRTAPGYDIPNILIRGRSSYNDAQAPLILVDGIERDFSDMDINEIENISVLKDAASLAWYGIRGANGVILVNTRTGSPGRMRLTFDGFGGVQVPEFQTKPLDSYTYASLYNEALQNDGFTPLYNQAALDAYKNGTNPNQYPNVNFVDGFMKSAAPVQRYVATVSGGNAAVKYFTSFSYYNQGGLFEGTKTPDYNSNVSFKRYNFRSNISAAVTDKLNILLNIGGRVENRIEPIQLSTSYSGIGAVLDALYLTPPNAYPILNADGSYGGTSTFINNPLGLLQSRGYNSNLNRVLLASSSARYKLDGITKGLSAQVMYAYDFSGLYQSGRSQNFDVYQQAAGSNVYTRFGGPRSALAFTTAIFTNSIRSNELWAGFDYQREFGQHGLDVSVRYNNSASFNPIANARFDFRRKGISSRVSYGYQQRYFADAVLNYSGNDRFAPGHRYGAFPALSLGWIISEEAFLHSVHPLDYLKVRGSYGVTGNENLFGSRLYNWQFLYNTVGISSYNFGTGFSSAGSATAEASLPNPDLGFEKSKKLDVGFDAKLFNQSLSLTLDYFQDKRIDLISPAFIPGFIGQALAPVNNGEAQYIGFETAINYTRSVNKITISVFGNFTQVKTNLNKYNDQPGLPDNQRQQGHPLGNFGLMYQATGIYQSQDDISKGPRPTLSGRVQPGDISYKDINGDGLIDNYDLSIMNYSSLPDAYYGFGATIKFAGFDLTAMFVGQSGGSVNISSIINAGNANNGFLNQYSVNRWTSATASTALYPRLSISDRGNTMAPSSFWIRSSDYLQLRNVEVGYSLPTRFVSRLRMESCRFYANAYNLATFGSLKKLDLSPDLVTAGRNSNYPYLAIFSGGINVKF